MATRADLERLHEGQVLTAVDLTRAEAAALNRSALVAVQPDLDGWKVTASHAVGVVRRGDLTVRVVPKVGVAKVLTLLARAHGVKKGFNVDAELVTLAPDADLSTVLAVMFGLEADSALAAGPLRGYRTEDQSLPVLRGRLRMRDQELRRFGMPVPLEVTVDEWTVDTDDNRRIRAATRALRSLPEIPAAIDSRLLRVERVLSEARLPTPGVRLVPWEATRLNARLHRLLHHADLVLDHASIEHGGGGTETRGFVVSMSWLFERLTERIFGERDVRWVGQKQLGLDADSRATIKPDLLLRGAASFEAVADTKYKLLDEDGKIPNADIYQLVTYCTRLGLPEGHLMYAGAPVQHPPYDLEEAGVTLHVHAIDLTRSLEEIEADVRAVAELAGMASAVGTGA